jgi:hypothetical protein
MVGGLEGVANLRFQVDRYEAVRGASSAIMSIIFSKTSCCCFFRSGYREIVTSPSFARSIPLQQNLWSTVVLEIPLYVNFFGSNAVLFVI